MIVVEETSQEIQSEKASHVVIQETEETQDTEEVLCQLMDDLQAALHRFERRFVELQEQAIAAEERALEDETHPLLLEALPDLQAKENEQRKRTECDYAMQVEAIQKYHLSTSKGMQQQSRYDKKKLKRQHLSEKLQLRARERIKHHHVPSTLPTWPQTEASLESRDLEHRRRRWTREYYKQVLEGALDPGFVVGPLAMADIEDDIVYVRGSL